MLTGFIYPVQGYWNWGGGFLSSGGYSDYAGSGTVHLCGAAAALAIVTVLGPRMGKYNADGTTNAMPGSNIPIAALGAWILWLGWFGFNGGSELVVSSEASAVAVSQVFLNTNMAAAGGVVGALILSLIMTGKMDVTMAINGAIAGLVGITAGPSAPSGGAAVLIGLLAGLLVYVSILYFEKKLKIDDPVGAIPVHLFAGIWGTVAVGLFGASAGFDQFMVQLASTGIVGAFCVISTLIIALIVKSIMGLRVSEDEETKGLDLSEHGTGAYGDFSMR